LRMDNERYGQFGFAVDYQLKGTAISAPDNGIIKYDLKVRNYNSIVSRRPWETPFSFSWYAFHPIPPPGLW